MHLESKAYDSPRDHSRPSTPASQGQGHSHSQPQHGPPTPAPPPARNISSASSSSGFVRRPRSAIVPPVTASFAPAQAQAQAQAQDLPVSPTSSSTSSLFSSVFSSAPYHTAPSWIPAGHDHNPSRNVLAPLSFQGHPVAVGEAAFSAESSGGYFEVGVGSGSLSGISSGNDNSKASSGVGGSVDGSGRERESGREAAGGLAQSEKTHSTPAGSCTYSEFTGPKPPSSSTSSANSAHSANTTNTAYSSRRPSRDGRPLELSNLAPFSTVFSLTNPPSPASLSRRSSSPPPSSHSSHSSHLSQGLINLRRPPYNPLGGSEYRATPRSYIIKPSDFDPGSDTHNSSHADNSLSLGLAWTPSAMISDTPGEPDNEYVRRQFLPRGSVIKASADGASSSAAPEESGSPPASRAGSGSAPGTATMSLPSSPKSPLPDSDLIELLNQDDRPTFIVDTAHVASNVSTSLCVLFANTALKERPSVLQQISHTANTTGSESMEQDYMLFKTWVHGYTKQDDKESQKDDQKDEDDQITPTGVDSTAFDPLVVSSPPTFAGWRWAVSTIRRRYRVVRGVREDGSPKPPSENSDVRLSALPEPAMAADSAPADSPAGYTPAINTPAEPDSVESIPQPDDIAEPAPESTVLPQDAADPVTPEEEASFDWTRIAITKDMPPHIAFARSVDWSLTPLGPIENWSSDLRLMSNLVMASPHPAAMYWGPSYTAIYNEAYTEMAGQKHPRLMGSNYPDSWAEIWSTIEPFFQSAWNAGQAVLKQDNRLFIKRNGFLEETFFNWSLVPLVGTDGSVVGLYNPAFENTRRKVNERRMLLLNEVGERTSKARTIPEFWDAAGSGLDTNEHDIPFALLYSVVGNNGSEDEDSDTTSTLSSNGPSSPQVVLEGSVGVPEGHKAAPAHLDLSVSEEGFAPYMWRSITEYKEAPVFSGSPPPIVLSREDETLPADLMAGLESERGFGDPCRTVVIIPVLNPSTASTGAGTTVDLNTNSNATHNTASHKSLYGFIVMGTNPRRPYNGDYRLFVHLLARQLTTSLASVVLYSEEVRRNQREAFRAAQDRHELSQQLILRTREAMESENKFMRMAEFTPVGMFVTDNTGKITYCNDMWWEISRHPKVEFDSPSTPATQETHAPVPMIAPSSNSPWATWMDSVQDEDQPALMVVWDRLVRDKMAITHEFRFKQRTTIHTDGNDPIETTTWVLLRAYPEKDDNGDLKGIFGCITDISQQKLAEEFQIQLRKEAVEHKRQQENFIDITSHEMRNPLSAILQTVDEITSSIGELRATLESGQEPDYASVFDNILEASNTISLCSNHQKRIVDDVLTLSKLDSRLLPVTPVAVQPVMVIRSTLKMFESEMIAHDIHCTFRVQPSYETFVGFSNWVKLDPSRLNQILINLLTNAIKFTQSSKERHITISLAASEGGSDPALSDVAESITELSYVPSRQEKPELADGPDWGDGQLVNLHVAVSDTGQGLHKAEKDELFQHFTQSFPRTHVQYGGSGLGLYICRSLAELQGGQISVTSEKDHGSTFAFYVKCRKVSSTPTGIEPGKSNLSSIVTDPLPTTDASPVIAYASGGSRDGTGLCHCKSKSKNFETPTLLPQLPSPPVLIDTPTGTPSEQAAAPFPHLEHLCVPTSTPTVEITSAPAATAENEEPSQAVDSTAPAVVEAMPPYDVLIVEDNLVNQRVLQRQLDKGGNRTIVANHGGEALDILRQSTFWRASDEPGDGNGDGARRSSSIAEIGSSPRPYKTTLGAGSLAAPDQTDTLARTNISIVLMDLEMPVMDGMTCARAIRALERSGTLLRHVPIIAVTAYARQEQIDSAKAAGIDDVISKPFRLTQLMPKIQELVTKYNTNPATLAP